MAVGGGLTQSHLYCSRIVVDQADRGGDVAEMEQAASLGKSVVEHEANLRPPRRRFPTQGRVNYGTREHREKLVRQCLSTQLLCGGNVLCRKRRLADCLLSQAKKHTGHRSPVFYNSTKLYIELIYNRTDSTKLLVLLELYEYRYE